ncbi:hypothetical protein [Sphingobacterium corticibacter]|uniref:Uncharacterized protein n=1 Tax=Sphingobacterium corticibacter TaxID=2171749 RepID=A0A2T8HIZ7_9SPHI|nr:hypothetical protein [Sphingobacterium corticibacter]PVH25414.1 hypothetical protein DC487_10915 [Sphingobacterium corticibacter]
MKRFVRVLGWVFLPFGVLALGLVLFFSYRNMRSQSQWVHRDATAILEIRSDQIIRELAGNALWNPRAYFGAARDTAANTDLQKLRPWNLGISLPANMYFFDVPAGSNGYFSIQTIDDLSRLQQVLSIIGWQIDLPSDNSYFWSANTTNKSLFIVGNEQQVVLAWNPKKSDEVVELMKQILDAQADLIEISTIIDQRPTAAKGDIIFWQPAKDDFWSMDLSAGKLGVVGLLDDSERRFSNKPLGAAFPDDNILSMRLHADIRPWLAKHKDLLQAQGLPWQEIEPYLGNYWELQWKNEAVIQSDTIITYDYDDNFEMVEKRELRNETVPYLNLAFMASPHLLSYLPEKLFYKFYKQQAGQLLLLSTDSQQAISSAQLAPQTDHFFLKYQQPDIWQAPIPLPSWLQKIQKGTFVGTHNTETVINLSGTVEFKDANLHPIKQLVDRL